jgi:hypothetical protein
MAPDPRPLRVLIVAPFERGLGHGGSQRATSMAERLEERGATIEWRKVDARRTSKQAKLRAALALRPEGVERHPQAALGGSPNVAVAAHSYLAHQLTPLPAGIVKVVDFHNLEWQHLGDSASFAGGLRGAYLHVQASLMRRFERRAIEAAELSLFTSGEELGWARERAPEDKLLLVPSVLPRETESEALQLADRPPTTTEPLLAYVGTVRFPPNLGALNDFLRDAWPAIRAAIPDARLTIAGDCSEQDRRALSDHPGVEALGFVDDINPLLARSAAVIMPISGRAGTSLRALYYALAGNWVIGTPAAFRSLEWEMGTTVETAEQWVRAVQEATEPGPDRRQRSEAARAGALALQRNPEPWDHLHRRMSELAASGARRP